MHLTILSYVGNEEDIIEACARHHAAVAQAMIFVTTGTDRTAEILQQLAAEGLPIMIHPHRPAYHDQHEILSVLMQEIAACNGYGGWILPLDADEFLLGDVPAAVDMLAGNRAVLLPWKTYVPHSSDDEDEPNVLRRITRRRRAEMPQFRKVLVPAGIVNGDTHIGRGNHALEGMQHEESDALAIAHFPVRSSDQLLRKVRTGWQNVLRNPARHADEAAHWRAMHERISVREQLYARELQDIALRYAMSAKNDAPAIVHDAVPCAFSLRYTV